MGNAAGVKPVHLPDGEKAPGAGYVIRGGHEGRARLSLLSRAMWPTTFRLLKRSGVGVGMGCLDLGCGSGEVTLGMARMVGPAGRVVGLDIDAVKLSAAREAATCHGLGNVEFRHGSVLDWSEEDAYDRIYARFLLSHLAECIPLLESIRHGLRPGGTVVIEDIDFTGSFCYPGCAAFDKYLDLYRAVVRSRKGDADIGPKLQDLLVRTGFQCVHTSLVQPFHLDQEEKGLALSTLVNISEAVIAEGLATQLELERTIAALADFTNDPTTIVSLPRVFQAWGRRP